jgi:hypothetical protein
MVKRRCSHVYATAQKGKGSAKINTDDEVLPASSLPKHQTAARGDETH